MIRGEIIQLLINKISAKKYLEIGVGNCGTFNFVNCEYKISVDPAPACHVTYNMTSDEFFNQNNEKFDIVFIDGLHWSEQVYRDIINSLSCLSENGYIVCHDISPMEEFIQRYPQPMVESTWTGDCWKAWVKLKTERKDLFMSVVDTDYGCGIINRGNQELIEVNEELTWDLLDKDRKRILNLITIEDFLKIYE